MSKMFQVAAMAALLDGAILLLAIGVKMDQTLPLLLGTFLVAMFVVAIRWE